jgi:hypothetical protein
MSGLPSNECDVDTQSGRRKAGTRFDVHIRVSRKTASVKAAAIESTSIENAAIETTSTMAAHPRADGLPPRHVIHFAAADFSADLADIRLRTVPPPQ